MTEKGRGGVSSVVECRVRRFTMNGVVSRVWEVGNG